MSHFILNKTLHGSRTYNTAIDRASELPIYLERAETKIVAIFKIKMK